MMKAQKSKKAEAGNKKQINWKEVYIKLNMTIQRKNTKKQFWCKKHRELSVRDKETSSKCFRKVNIILTLQDLYDHYGNIVIKLTSNKMRL